MNLSRTENDICGNAKLRGVDCSCIMKKNTCLKKEKNIYMTDHYILYNLGKLVGVKYNIFLPCWLGIYKSQAKVWL